MTNARLFYAPRDCRSAPSPSRPHPFRFANRALVTSDNFAWAARAAAFRLRLGSGAVALRLRFAMRASPPSAPLSPLADRRPKPRLTLAGSIQMAMTNAVANKPIKDHFAFPTHLFAAPKTRRSETTNSAVTSARFVRRRRPFCPRSSPALALVTADLHRIREALQL